MVNEKLKILFHSSKAIFFRILARRGKKNPNKLEIVFLGNLSNMCPKKQKKK
jgi:hypothetical protein